MQALVVGASGQVGTALMSTLQRRGHDATGTYYTHPMAGYVSLDMNDQAKVRTLVLSTRPDWIFFAAGMTHADRCEEQPDKARRQIAEDPVALASFAREIDAGFVYYSSAYVFDGKDGPYGEEDAPNPLSVYGRCKLEAEQAIQATLSRWLIIRTVVVYGPEPQAKNFVCQVLRNAKCGARMPVAIDQISNTTFNEDLALATVELTEGEKVGLYHLAGPDGIGRYSFARMVCAAFDLDPAFLEPATTAQLLQQAPRPLDARLGTDKASAELRTGMRPAQEGLEAMRECLQMKAGKQ